MGGVWGPWPRKHTRHAADTAATAVRVEQHAGRVPDAEQECCTLYHQTSPENAAAILDSGGRMRRSFQGFGGRGVYFAPDPEATTCKANHHGVILECRVRLGRVRRVSRAGAYCSRLRQWLLRYDSVALTFLEGGVEFVVFDPARVMHVRVHRVLHTSASASSVGAAASSSSSSSSSLRIATAADPCRCSSSSSSDGDSFAAASGDSFAAVSGNSFAAASGNSGSSGSGDSSSSSADSGDSAESTLRSVNGDSSSSSSSRAGTGGTSGHPLSAADIQQHKLRTQHEQQQVQEQQQRILQQALHASLLHARQEDAQQEEERQRDHKQQQQPAQPCGQRVLACC